ncbi:Chitin binding domain [Paramyrothecium foliicola]|nr:Chitin binding domain [Paramyrothecium foliicola]
MFAKSIAYASIASMATAHIIMSNPPAYRQVGDVFNAPLHDKHAPGIPPPFPCGTTTFSGVESTAWEAGSTQNVKFTGTAVHGGGSCQISVSTDLNPTESSTWKVIKSIEGGCPAKNQAGNIEPGNAELPLPEGYDVEVPDLPAGSYTLAWTWFNRLGNREMYMNCAPIEIIGGGGSVDPSSLPDMFIAHIPQTTCNVPDGGDLKFPNPGSNVVQYGAGTYMDPVGDCGPVGGAGTVVNPVTPPPNNGGSTPPPPPPPVNNPPPATGGACTEGSFKCIDGASFSMCAAGAWSVAMSVAPGTSCVIGEGATLNLA